MLTVTVKQAVVKTGQTMRALTTIARVQITAALTQIVGQITIAKIVQQALIIQ